ncbi:acylamino-acid-releasing enzyme-like isoform X1 [Lycorma delicatula]|uniref:acylamino-acid-releasing enzyme-like isoform X1 n=2 Tax=Lycorma delicatula TaxID=130591 RepID=UPI003F50D879
MDMDKVVKTFRTVALVPTISEGKILRSGTEKLNRITIHSLWSERCLERGKNVKIQQTYLVDLSDKDVITLMPSDSSSEILSSISHSQESRAVIREVPSQENSSKKLQHLEIWSKSRLLSVSDLTAIDIHGDVYADSEFSCFEWSPCENKLLYIAEKKVPKTEPFYKQKPQNNKDDAGSGDGIKKGDEYVFRQDWGEQLVGKHQPVVAVYDLKTEKITILEGIPDHYSPGQAIWCPGGGIVGVAWENEPFRLGLMFCTNRISYIFHLTSDGNFKILSKKGLSVSSPRFSPDGKKVIWLERLASGTHHATHRLVKYCWSSGEIETVIDIIKEKLDDVNAFRFRGLYIHKLPKRCWSSDNTHIVFSTPGPVSITSCIVNTDNKKITLLQADEEEDSLIVLDVVDNIVLCSRSNLRFPSSLIVGKLPSGVSDEIQWISVTDWNCFPGLENVEHKIYFTSATSNSVDNVKQLNALYLKPVSNPGQKVPLIVWPHGGPHTNFVNSFNTTAAFFALLGYGVVLINYRGSTGLGDNYTECLLGKIGDMDVKDVHQVAEEVCHLSYTNFDSSRKVLFGGSHGGFLVSHLSGQYPESYKAVCTINPVENIMIMVGITDIPDWCAVESGGQYSLSDDVPKDDLAKMYNASPLRHANKVKAPTLLLLGKKDLRVPCSQGLQLFKRLKANNITTKLLMYDDNHSLSQVPVEMDSLINSVLWFNEHLNISQE